MRILVVGGGGREHALVWALVRRRHEVIAAPGNPGIGEMAECVAVRGDDIPGLVRLAVQRDVDLVVVGPEAPLVAGLADALTARGVVTFGPGAQGARLEGSKAFCRELLARHGVPGAEFAVCTSMAEVEAALARLGGRVVVKADGLAAGKGVVVCADEAEAREAAAGMLAGAHGEAGLRLLVERRLSGREASILALTDGKRFAVLAAAEDHKAVFDGDKGPNTGGMGAISPTPAVGPEVLERVRREVLAKTVHGLAAEGIPYRGVLYAGVMVAVDGTPNVLEYNCRFGDPEAEAILVRWADDPADWLYAAARGELPEGEPEFTSKAAACVVMTAEGYPGTVRTGDPISGVPLAGALPDVQVFHAGTRREEGRLFTAGGRVLAVTALGDGLADARARAYEAVGRISWPGAHYRTDIGGRG